MISSFFPVLTAALSATLNLSAERFFLIAIVLLACILGAEIAGICILIGKVRRAHGKEEDSERHYALGILLLGIVPRTTYAVFYTLAGAAAVGAIVLAVLLVVFRCKGYLFLAGKERRKEADTPDVDTDAGTEAAESVTEAEGAAEDAVADDEADAPTDAEADIEEPPMEENLPEREQEEIFSAEETVPADAAEPSVPVSATVPEQVPMTAAGTQQVPPYAGAPGSVRIIEKHFTETHKEVVHETTTNNIPTPAAVAKDTPLTEELLRAITELLKVEKQHRLEREMAVESPRNTSDATVAAGAGEKHSLREDAEFPESPEDDAEDDDDDTDLSADGDVSAEDNDGEEPDAEDGFDSDLFDANERIVGFDEETGYYIVARYRKSFEAKLIQSRPAVKRYYSALKNAVMAYEGTRNRISWGCETFTNEHTQIAKFNARAKTLEVYLALDPAGLEGTVYHGRDVGGKKKYADTPFLYKVTSPRKLTLALELIQRTCEEQGLSPIDLEEVNYEEQYPFEATDSLIARGLIREYLREEKPAVSFELDPDHVPAVPDEDASVIPANANFTWELDDEAEKATEPEPEQVPEPEPAPEEMPEPEPEENPEEVTQPAAPVPASTTTVSRETVHIVEQHYKETFYHVPDSAGKTSATKLIEGEAEETATLAEPSATIQPTETVEESAPEIPEIPEVPEPAEEAVEEDEPAEEDEVAEEDEPTEEDEPAETPPPAPSRPEPMSNANPNVALIDVCLFDHYFENGSVVDLDAVKEVGLAPESATVLKVYASGSVKGKYTVEANHFTRDALIAIGEADGDSILIR